jgi:hypothetical protein
VNGDVTVGGQPEALDLRCGGSADLAGLNLRTASGLVTSGGIAFTGTLADGSIFSGKMANHIDSGCPLLDGCSFINARTEVSLPLP